MQLRSVLAVFLGGALGTAARALLQEALPEWWLLFLVNALGSALLGLAVATLSRAPSWVRHGVGAGVLGGFTSYSAVAVASVSAAATTGGWTMLLPALPGVAVALGMLAISLLSAWAGLALGRRLAIGLPPGRRPGHGGAA